MPDRRQHVPPGVTGDGEPRAGLGSLSGRETPGTATGPMASEVSNNTEWQLSELVDAVAAEIDHAEDTLSLKSFARGMSFAIKQLSLDLEVTVRRADDGRILFRTVDPGETSPTLLKLDFAQVIQSQLEAVRKPLDRPADERVLATLPGITQAEITALNAIAIFSVGDLERYTQSAAMVAEVSRKTGIPDPRIRLWRQLPFITELKPPFGPRGSVVIIDGGNFGTLPDPNALVLFQGRPATILSWSASRVSVEMPDVGGPGVVFVVVGAVATNALAWEATTIDLRVRDILVSPAHPVEGDPVTVEAVLVNDGTGAAGPFHVQWTVDGVPQPSQPHGPLPPGQRSMESTTRRQLALGAGTHTVQLTADALRELPDIDRSNSTFSRRIVVGALQQLTIADFRPIATLDPLLNDSPGPADVLSLVFRGLGRLDPTTGVLVPDCAASWKLALNADGSGTLAVQLRDDVRFQDGTPLTAADVAFTYETLKHVESPWTPLVTSTFRAIVQDDERSLSFTTRGDVPAQLLTIGLVPRHAYEPDPAGFGQRPIGSGPFRVDLFRPGETIELSAFRDFAAGAPRLDRVVIPIVPNIAQLEQMVLGHEMAAAALPYTPERRQRVEASGDLRVVALPIDQPRLLHVQVNNVQERQPNPFDTTWNAQLWYILTTFGLSALSLSAGRVLGGSAIQGSVTLNNRAPVGGAMVLLASSNTDLAAVPSSVTVPEGQISAAFSIATRAVGGDATITASRAGTSRTAPLAVVGLAPLALASDRTVGGASVQGTVRLTGPAPAGGAVVGLASSSTALASVPASVSIAEGQTSVAFAVTTTAAAGEVEIRASLGGVIQSARLSVVVAQSVTLGPPRVLGGASAQATVTLSGPAPTGGAVVSLASTNTTLATLPATVTVPAGQTSATCAVATTATPAGGQVEIRATLGGITQSATLTVVVLTSLTLSAPSVIGGSTVQAMASLSGPAPAGGVVVGLASTNAAVATVPADSASIPANQSSIQFPVTSKTTAGQADIRASVGGLTRGATLSVVVLNALSLGSDRVIGGGSVQATLVLSGPAPAGGAAVSLSTSNAGLASVPSSVTVPGGQTSATFSVSSKVAAGSVDVIATLGGLTRAASLTVVVLQSLAFSPARVGSGTSSLLTVALSGQAPAGGVVVSLSSSNTAVLSVAASVTVAAGQSSTALNLVPEFVRSTPATATVTVTGALAGVSRSGTLTVDAEVKGKETLKEKDKDMLKEKEDFFPGGDAGADLPTTPTAAEADEATGTGQAFIRPEERG